MDSMIANAWHGLMQAHAGKVVVLERGAIRAVGHTLQEVLHYVTRHSTVIHIPADADHHLTARDLLGIGWDLLQGAAPEIVRTVVRVVEGAVTPPPEPVGDGDVHAELGKVTTETKVACFNAMNRAGAEYVDRSLHIWRLPDGHTYSLLDFARGRPIPVTPPAEPTAQERAEERAAAAEAELEDVRRQLAAALEPQPTKAQRHRKAKANEAEPPVVPARAHDTIAPASDLPIEDTAEEPVVDGSFTEGPGGPPGSGTAPAGGSNVPAADPAAAVSEGGGSDGEQG